VVNGAFAPPSQNCYILDRMEFLHFIYTILVLIAFFSQKCPTAPPRQISGYATAYKSNKKANTKNIMSYNSERGRGGRQKIA
jgi:hypothetical protein